MAIKVAQAVKSNVYNGTHGNLSVQHVNVPALADGDQLVAIKLEAGVQLVELKVLTKGAAIASLTAKATLNEVNLGDGLHAPQVGKKLEDVIANATAAPAGVLTSDKSGYFPSEVVAGKDKFLVVTFAGAAVTADKVGLAVYTTSVGTI
ncbi:TPA: hypothetical protein P0E30_003763 [Vibrio harveyi]|nr:hypothetical protein [Vibrio harveyi]